MALPVKHVVKSAVLLILAALVLETFVFNFNYFRTAGYHTTNLDNRLSLTKTLDNQYRVTEVNHVIEFKNLNSEVHNVWLNFDYRQPAQQLKVKIQFTHEAHSTYFDSTEYTVGVPEVDVNTLCDQSEYINLNTTGLVTNLQDHHHRRGYQLPGEAFRCVHQRPGTILIQSNALPVHVGHLVACVHLPSEVGHLPHRHRAQSP